MICIDKLTEVLDDNNIKLKREISFDLALWMAFPNGIQVVGIFFEISEKYNDRTS